MNLRTSESSREIVSRSGSNLAFALAVLPPEKRQDMRVFYAFCRVIDDIADEAEIPLKARLNALDHWRSLVTDSTPQKGVEAEFVELRDKYRLSHELLNEIIDGVSMDLEPLRFASSEDLKTYCYKVASAVGLVSIEIFGYHNEQTKIYARELGYALQWTNIMRDVGEDADEARVYLPQEDLETFGLNEKQILARKVPEREFQDLMAHQSVVARKFYQSAKSNLPDEDRSSMRSPELMHRIYLGILNQMENDNYRVFEKRYRLSKVRMLSEFLRAKFLT